MDHENHALGIIGGDTDRNDCRARESNKTIGAESADAANGPGVALPVRISTPDDHVECDECFADPAQYLADFEEECPTCKGAGHFLDPDYLDPDDVFDPVSEWGTYRAINGRMA